MSNLTIFQFQHLYHSINLPIYSFDYQNNYYINEYNLIIKLIYYQNLYLNNLKLPFILKNELSKNVFIACSLFFVLSLFCFFGLWYLWIASQNSSFLIIIFQLFNFVCFNFVNFNLKLFQIFYFYYLKAYL